MSNKPDHTSPQQAKNMAILLAWVFTILILAGAFWIFTQPLRTRVLVNAVNRVFVQSGDSWRLAELTAQGGTGLFGMVSWFTVTGSLTENAGTTGETRIVIFPFIGEGTFFPCAAVVNPEGRVEEFIPLNNHGKRVMSRISPGILEIYARRIEGNRL